MKRLNIIKGMAALILPCLFSCTDSTSVLVSDNQQQWGDDVTNFTLTGQVNTDCAAIAALWFHSNKPGEGYEVRFHNGPIDGTQKTGSLTDVRNLYRSLAADSTWADFEISVRQKNIEVKINKTTVVSYTEPNKPWRDENHSRQQLSHGKFRFIGYAGRTTFRNLKLTPLPDNAVNPNDTLPPVDEQQDRIIRLQQQEFPVIDYHVHLKGGLTKEQAHAMSMNYGINYGVAPNLGEGGVGRMLANDQEAIEYHNEVKDMPFLMGAQGEGRRWIVQFTDKAISRFDYLFTDAMTIVDNGKICRIYHPEEVHMRGRTQQQYMDLIVDQIVKILTNEPVDIYANATYIPEDWMPQYDQLWTPERIDRVLDVMQQYDIAMEISPRYHIPSFDIIRRAKARGLKFTFGTNNVDADFGRCEYAIQAIDSCNLTPSDIWFPSMSRRAGRQPVDYNHFGQ